MGSDLPSALPPEPRRGFNSRSRMGSDRPAVDCRDVVRGFNSRSRMGSDSAGDHCGCLARGFNSRSRMGSDSAGDHCGCLARGFNSRSRMGSDCYHAMTGTACIESALFASQAGKVLWGKTQFVCHVFKSISIQYAISAANTPAFR